MPGPFFPMKKMCLLPRVFFNFFSTVLLLAPGFPITASMQIQNVGGGVLHRSPQPSDLTKRYHQTHPLAAGPTISKTIWVKVNHLRCVRVCVRVEFPWKASRCSHVQRKHWSQCIFGAFWPKPFQLHFSFRIPVGFVRARG